MSFVYRALQALFIFYENTFEVKTGKGHYKVSFETINVKIGSYLGSPGAKNCSKKGPKFPFLSSFLPLEDLKMITPQCLLSQMKPYNVLHQF